MVTVKSLLIYILQTTTLAGAPVDPSKVDIEEAYCLAEAVYYEARSEGLKGQQAVASATMNRVGKPAFSDTICGVVRQTRRIGKSVSCAFSWYCDEQMGRERNLSNKNGEVNPAIIKQLENAVKVSLETLNGETKDITKGATHFHNPEHSQPTWANEMRRTLRLGNHDFYK